MENQRKRLIERYMIESEAVWSKPEDESLTHLWAISYADLLMVLMSFFIVFFSFSNRKSESFMNHFSATFSKAFHAVENPPATAAAAAVAPAPAAPKASAEKSPSALLQVIGTQFGSKVHFEKDGQALRSLTLDLDENVFEAGGYKLSARVKNDLDGIFKVLLPYRDSIEITFIGYTDETIFNPKKAQLAVHSNISLSVQRASSAVEYANSKGLSPESLKGEGQAEFGRKSRSISVKITERSSP